MGRPPDSCPEGTSDCRYRPAIWYDDFRDLGVELASIEEELERRVFPNIFSFDVAEFRFWLNVVVGFIDHKGRRRHAGNVTRALQIEPFPFVANFAPDKIDAQQLGGKVAI